MIPGNILETIVIVVLTIWSILWKCYSVWNAAKNGHKKWFIALIILNTIGILDMIYVFKVLKKDFKTVKKDFSRALDFLK
ncbi:MAG: hypothetical protein KBD14_00475 [Candidatus Pacebacteria bacterium]|nr:hypothetical protein [Candidatus Paceibacterota bacterium]